MKNLLLLLALTAGMAQAGEAYRLMYHRYENGAKITGYGTAFGIDLSGRGDASNKKLLTAKHNIINDATKTVEENIFVEINGDWLRAEADQIDPELDICTIKIKQEVPFRWRLGDKEASVGDLVTMLGSARGLEVRPYDGVVTKLFHNSGAYHLLMVVFDHGDSGSPVVKDGVVVGMAVAGVPENGDLAHDRGLYLPIAVINAFLDKYYISRSS